MSQSGKPMRTQPPGVQASGQPEQLKGVLGNLSPREAKIMSLRFGLADGKPHTLDEIGKYLGLTRERIRQLEKESLSKLRHPSNTRPLLDWAS